MKTQLQPFLLMCLASCFLSSALLSDEPVTVPGRAVDAIPDASAMVAEILRLSEELRTLRADKRRMQRDMQNATREMFRRRIERHVGVDLSQIHKAQSLLTMVRVQRQEAAVELLEAEFRLLEFDGSKAQHELLSDRKEECERQYERADEKYRLAMARLGQSAEVAADGSDPAEVPDSSAGRPRPQPIPPKNWLAPYGN